MPPEFFTQLIFYGPLGILAVAASAVAVRVYKDKKESDALHQKQYEALAERYIKYAEEHTQKYHELARSMNAVLDSIQRRAEEKRMGRGG